ncbi:sigma-70 family RNA polymerase sigma factor [Priestia megaterium]|uniref:RNA polymerase sigma factor n=1 Tax=Priestia megaterium TaxID=1404 RepID=A0A6H1P513_PRIMG|nr:sigma-70 family RNA polymerase sigma factor [Priestia megaterium]QIZ08507.1 sigma-70 family RNA polymerase sigma factor [Priestia megaterium]
MNREFDRLNRSLSKYINDIPLNQEIDIDWLLKIVKVLLNKDYSESLLIEFLKSKSFSKFSIKIEEEKSIQNENASIDDYDDEDFDPNEFLEKNKDTIKYIEVPIQRNYEENTLLIEKYQQSPNEDTLAEIVTFNMGLVEKMASRYGKGYKHDLYYDDLVSIGKFGLIKAIGKFNTTMGYQFSTYATWWIRQAITRAIMDEGSTIRIPVHLYEQIARMIKVENECVRENNKLDIDWVCENLNITREKYNELKKIDYNILSLASLNSIVSEEDDDSSLIDFVEYSPFQVIGAQIGEFVNPIDRILYKDLNDILIDSLSSFSERDQEIIRLRFGLDNGQGKTLEDVGKVFGVTRERIRQIEAKTIAKLRKKLLNKQLSFKDLIPQ